MKILPLSILCLNFYFLSFSQSSCYTIKLADPSSTDGLYSIDPDGSGGNPAYMVWCDMTTDEGGWTLVSATTDPVDDLAQGHSPNLESVNPTGNMAGIWDGMRPLLTADSDIRFSCCDLSVSNCDVAYTVDMIFYENQFYNDVTTGPADVNNCFEEGNGTGYSLPPRRTNLISGETLPEGDDWDWAYLEGEDNCGDANDFTVDFDDRGMDSNQGDGTDWGEDDGAHKCGNNAIANGEWFIWVREGDPSLPVEWAGFNVFRNGNRTLLSWLTAVEINNDGFEIQHSIDGNNFTKIGWIEGEGNTDKLTQYSFIHSFPQIGINYYRIKQVDFDGKFGYSDTQTIKLESIEDTLTIYPNPVEDYLNLKFQRDQGIQTILLMDLKGKILSSYMFDTKNGELMVNVKGLQPGVFLIKMNGTVQRFIKSE